MLTSILGYIFLVIAAAGILLNILALYSSLKIIKGNDRVYQLKLDASLYKEPVNFRFFYVILAAQLMVWMYSSIAFDLDNLPQSILKLVWMNNNILLLLFAVSSVFYFVMGGHLWKDPVKNHSKITFRAFAVVASFALTASTHFVIYFLEFKHF